MMYQIKNRKQNRMPDFEYSSVGYYFVTICTQDRELFFGDVDGGEMILNEMGKIAVDCWDEIPDHFQYIALDEFVVMPNHIQNEQPLSITRPHQLLPVVIGSYKSAVTKLIHRLSDSVDSPKYFGWQRSYHDSIIRDEPSLHRIRAYIKNNPANWVQDKNYRK